MYKLFSNWIFCWFYLFCNGFTTANPLIILILGYIFTIGGFIYIYKNKAPKQKLTKYIIKNLFIKLLFIITVLSKYNFIFAWYDVFVAISLYVSYLLIMVINNVNPVNHYLHVFNTYINDNDFDNNKKYLNIIRKLYDIIYNNIKCMNCSHIGY